jgi:hypothetical protein
MNRKVRTVQIGYGRMGRCIVTNMVESGADVIAIFDANPKLVGQKAEGLNITIDAIGDLRERLNDLMPDVAIVATQSLMRDVEPILLTCAECGVSVVTTCDEALYPWTSSPAITKRLDRAARATACTISSSGFPDLAYCSMIAATCGAAHKIDKITGVASYNVDDYGIALANHHGVGLSKEEFEKTIGSLNDISEDELQKMINEGTFTPIPMWNTNSWLCAKLGLHILHQRQINTPIFLDHDIYSSTMGRILKAGETIGMSAKAITETKEGIRLETESIGKVYEEGEEDLNDWTICGNPDIKVANQDIDNEGMICALIVSRIVDVLNGPTGFVTSNHFPPATFLLCPLNEYITAVD